MSTDLLTPSMSEAVSDSTTRLVRMGNLATHPAQMRTVYEPAAMAALTLQLLHTGGVAELQPIVATLQPEGAGYYIVSGHRRRMALLFSWAFTAQHPDLAHQDTLTPEVVQTFLDTVFTHHPTIEAAAEALLPAYADREVSIHLFTGDLKEQILALQRANYGADAPDPLGIAKSFHAAITAGATERQIAHNAGQSLGYVRKHLALMRVPLNLAQAIAAGTLPLSIAEPVAEVQPEVARQGVALFIVSNVAHVTVEGVRACVTRFKSWDGFRTPPMTVAHQGQRNMIRLLAHLWHRVLDTDSTNAWASATLLLYRNISPHAPWESQSAFTEWIKVLGGEAYYREPDGIRWGPLIRECLTNVACDTCPLSTLPSHLLTRDLSDRPDGLGRPCRTLQRDDFTRCINGFAPGDPVDVRVPFEWASHPGVAKQESHYVVSGMEALQAAWQAQAEAEAAVDTAIPTETQVGEESDEQDNATEPAKPVLPSPPASEEDTPVAAESPATPATPQEPSPIALMRATIQDYMARHTEMDWRHPFATPCATCQHRLEQSPTKDPNVPNCAWAARLRTVRFSRLVSEDDTLTIPVCSQYASSWTWQDRIPVPSFKPPFPREYMLAQIRNHAKTHAGNPTFEFLTGRPMGPASYGDWFETQLVEAVGHLSDKQLFTLLVWSITEHDRAARMSPFWMPADKHLTSFIPVREISWR